MNSRASEVIVTGTDTDIGLLSSAGVKHSATFLRRPRSPVYPECSQLNSMPQSARLSQVFRNIFLTLEAKVRLSC